MTNQPTISMGAKDTLRIELPDGIGYVEIRTGNVQGSTGNPVIAVEVHTATLDTPAKDGRVYEPEYRRHENAIHLIGYPTTFGDGKISVTIREVPAGWVAYRDDDRRKVVAGAVVYDELERKLRELDRPVYIMKILATDPPRDCGPL